MKIYVIFTGRQWELEVVGVFDDLQLAKAVEAENTRHFIKEFEINSLDNGNYI